MFRILILIIIFLAFSYGGYAYGEKFNKRYKNLKEILKNILLLQNEIVYNMTPLPEALQSIGMKCRTPIKELVLDSSHLLSEGKEDSVYDAFKHIYEKENNFYLNRDDERVLEDFLKSLGELGVYGQEKMFNLVISNLNINIKEAEIELNKNIKLYRYLGVCIGGMIFIFLL